MTTAATSLLGLALPVTGELSGTWGDTVNNSITSLLDTAIAGTTTLSTDGDVTLSTTTLASNQARQAILLCSGARTAIRTITAPAQSKIYTVINSTTGGYAVKIVGVGPTTGVTIGSGQSAQVAWNGSDFVQVGASAGGSNTQVQYNNSGALAGSANLTFNGTTLTANALTITNATTLSAGTANGVAYLNGSKVVTTGSALTFDGTTLGVVTASGADTVLLNLTGNSGIRQQFNPTNSTGTKYNWRIDVNGLVDQTWSLVPSTAVGGSTFSTPVYQANGNGTQIWSVGSTEAMRLTSTGLGIGTSSPAYKLDAQTTATGTAAGDNTVGYFGSLASGRDANIRFGDSVNASARIGYLSGALYMYTSGAERMRLDTSGNLGLGVTPSASSACVNMEFGSYGATLSARNTSSAPQFAISSNAVGNWYAPTYKINGKATQYTQQGFDGTHAWYVAGTGTAGNAITFTQAMTLDASGNLGIGTSSPAYKLDVYQSTGGASNYIRVGAGSYGYALIGVDGTGMRIQSDSASNPMYFITNGSERARIDAGGNFLVGTARTINSAALTVKKAVNDNIAVFDNSGGSSPYGIQSRFSGVDPNNTGSYYFEAYSAVSTIYRFYVRSNGGISNYQANDTNLSDRREKTNFAPAGDYLAKICAIPVQTFNYIDQNMGDDPGLTLGVVAQDVQAVAPELVMESNWAKEGEEPKMRLSIYQTDLQYALMKALQELKAEFDAYKATHP